MLWTLSLAASIGGGRVHRPQLLTQLVAEKGRPSPQGACIACTAIRLDRKQSHGVAVGD